MSENVQLKASDGHELDAYVARPAGAVIAGLVVLQEAFGVNGHIRSVADSYAKDGFLAVAPALFDRLERGVQLGYEGEDLQRGLGLARQSDPANGVKDISAALEYVRRQTGKKTGVIGYCFGGTMAWLTSTRLRPDAAVGYYGGNIARFATETPSSFVMLHFGKQDTHIPREDIDKLQAAHPQVAIFWYDAGHGFSCDVRASYHADAARLARERSLEFLKKHLVK